MSAAQPDADEDDVHVDWHMTRAEWEQLSGVLAARPDVPYVAALLAAGKLPTAVSEMPAQPDVGEARAALERAIWLCFPFPKVDAGPKHRARIADALAAADVWANARESALTLELSSAIAARNLLRARLENAVAELEADAAQDEATAAAEVPALRGALGAHAEATREAVALIRKAMED